MRDRRRANQLFKWRREMLPKAAVKRGAMVPVEIVPQKARRDRRRTARGRIYRDWVRVRRAGVPSRRGFARNTLAGDPAIAMIGLPAGTRVWLGGGRHRHAQGL